MRLIASHVPVLGAPGYLVSCLGRVYSAVRWRGQSLRPLVAELDKDGYPRVRLTVGGVRLKRRVHRLVAVAFLPVAPSALHEIRHLDGNPVNCRWSNLAWGTRQDNANDREAHGRTSRGKRHGQIIRAAIAKARSK